MDAETAQRFAALERRIAKLEGAAAQREFDERGETEVTPEEMTKMVLAAVADAMKAE